MDNRKESNGLNVATQLKNVRMLLAKGPLFPVSIATVYLVAYTLVVHLYSGGELSFLMYLLSPFVVLWMVFKILKEKGPAIEEPFPYD